MTHFSVLVVTDEDPRKDQDPCDQGALYRALLPYHEYECTGIEEYTEFVPADMNKLREEYEAHKEHFQSFEDFALDWSGDKRNEQGVYGRLTNPNRKWDWWTVGGRFSGLMVNHDGVAVDILQRKDLSLELTYIRDHARAVSAWEHANSTFQTATDRRLVYGISPDETREQYLARCAEFFVSAVLQDGIWHQQGDIGWWGSIANEDPEWPQRLAALIDAIPDDRWLTVVDCHI